MLRPAAPQGPDTGPPPGRVRCAHQAEDQEEGQPEARRHQQLPVGAHGKGAVQRAQRRRALPRHRGQHEAAQQGRAVGVPHVKGAVLQQTEGPWTRGGRVRDRVASPNPPGPHRPPCVLTLKAATRCSSSAVKQACSAPHGPPPRHRLRWSFCAHASKRHTVVPLCCCGSSRHGALLWAHLEVPEHDGVQRHGQQLVAALAHAQVLGRPVHQQQHDRWSAECTRLPVAGAQVGRSRASDAGRTCGAP